jgi:hypothetical protein
MAISDVIEKLGRAVFEAPFGGARIAKDAPEFAEIRLAILDCVKAQSHRAAGKSVFPYNLVCVRLLGVPADQASVFEGEFLAAHFLEELKNGLVRSSFRFPDDLRLEFGTSPDLPLPGQQWLSVSASMEERSAKASERGGKIASLTVLNGTANGETIKVKEGRTNIGRTAEVFRSAGPSRRNDLAFTGQTEIDGTVSREHAHILFSRKDGTYRLFNDRVYKGESNCGLWITRDGLSQPVHRGSRGLVLEDGDEIHLGSALIRFSFAPPAELI